MTQPAKHTPGPWYPHLAKADHCLSSSVWGAEPGNQVAVIGGKSLQTMNANATLIAAAPAMYTLLQDATLQLARLTGSNLETYARTFSVLAKKALAQAEGR